LILAWDQGRLIPVSPALVFRSRTAWRQRSFLFHESMLSSSFSDVKPRFFPQLRVLYNAISGGED
jgi:hypothetical protein